MIRKQLLTPEETAEVLGFVPQTIRMACRRGDIPAQKMMRRWRIAATFVDGLATGKYTLHVKRERVSVKIG